MVPSVSGQNQVVVFAFGLILFLLWYVGRAPGPISHIPTHSEMVATDPTSAVGPIHEFIFDERTGRTRACHAATLVETPDGGVLAAWFGGGAEGAADVSIWSANRAAGPAGTWSDVREIANAGTHEAHWNPVFFWGTAGRLWLHFKVGDMIPLWRTYVSYSDDLGATWAAPKELVPGDEGGRGCVKNKPLVLDDAILCGASTERVSPPVLDALADAANHKEEGWNCFVDRSTDGGLTFERTPDLDVPDGAGIIQPTLWQSAPGKVHMLMRSDSHHVYRADSEDGGRTWSPANSTDLPNNNSGLDLVQLKGGFLVLAYNPTTTNWGGRWPLRLSISTDNGKTWPESFDLETQPGEFSYPAVVPWSNGEGFHLAYTWNRQRMRYFSASLAQLREHASPTPPPPA